jgi:probable rRNA maturation factor
MNPVSKLPLSLGVQFAAKSVASPSRQQVRAWLRVAQEFPAEVTVRFVDAEEGRQLNFDYRGKDYATNVLSFPYESSPVCMGDLVLCVPVVEREALEQTKPIESHYAHMMVHGMLHLQAYNHENELDAVAMEAVETHIMRKLGYTDPYEVTEVKPQHG